MSKMMDDMMKNAQAAEYADMTVDEFEKVSGLKA